MPRFVARPIVVEAHQYDGNTVAMPDAFRMAVRRHLPGGTVEVMAGEQLRACKHGDWIVRGPDGQFSVVRDAAFETMFEPHRAAPAALPEPGKRLPTRKEAAAAVAGNA
jgi:hypothetical protein